MSNDNCKSNRNLKYTRVGLVSLGCSKNAVDSEILLGELKSRGFEVVNDAAQAEIIIVNTCGFIESAKTDSIDTILDMAQYKAAGSCKLLVVTGCLSQRYGDELARELPEVDVFNGVKNYPAFAERLAKLCNVEPSETVEPAEKSDTRCCIPNRLLTTPPYRAYLRIADGCDNRCTYCAIPLIRGGRVSAPMEQLIAEAEQLAKGGVTELTVIAQDTSAYGIDLYGKPMLRELLERLTEIDGLHWVRVLYAYPNTVTEELVDAMNSNPKICSYIDIPIQHISAHMLRDMNRHGSAEHIREITDYIRRNAPGFILRTTVMLGFPGETEADFDELMQFMAEHPFDRVGAFTYSAEDGTPAAAMPGAVEHEIAERRLDKLMRQQMKISLELNRARIGTVVEALVDGADEEFLFCRSYAEAADVDGVIKVPHHGRPVPAGSYINIKITGADYYDLCGELA